MAPFFPVQVEGPHAAEFILSEAAGQRSRGAAWLTDPVTIKPGQPIKVAAAATSDTPTRYIPAVGGADCEALSIYGGVSTSGNDLNVAILMRDCEVNGKLINWPTGMTNTEKALGIAKLATNGIIVR
jgi:hypothetical protein